jgi:phosphatidylglycerophosphate synthase
MTSPQARGYAEALAALQGAQKTPAGVSLYSRHVNRPLGRRLGALAYVMRVTPDVVTLVSGLLSLGAAAVVATVHPRPWLGLVVAAVLVLAFALDAADGQLARLLGQSRPRGEWLDHMTDCVTKLLLHACVLVGWYRFTDRGAGLLVPLGLLGAVSALFFGTTLVPKLLPPTVLPDRLPKVGSGLLLLPVDTGIVALAFGLWGWPDAFAIAWAVLLAAHVVLLVALSARWWKAMA